VVVSLPELKLNKYFRLQTILKLISSFSSLTIRPIEIIWEKFVLKKQSSTKT